MAVDKQIFYLSIKTTRYFDLVEEKRIIMVVVKLSFAKSNCKIIWHLLNSKRTDGVIIITSYWKKPVKRIWSSGLS